MNMKSIICNVIVIILWILVHVEAAREVIKTSYGPVRGDSITLRTGKRVIKFLGIPYANASRFEPPRPPTTWNTTFSAIKFGKSCPQATNHPIFKLKLEDLSEYCLTLNIYAPNTTDFQNKLASYPVLVWLHGGAYISGTSSIYDASIMATKGDIVIVTLNYRLGALGFLSLGGVDGLDGNYGVLDIISALRWVKNNIEGFGGDPKKVTLGGWSAGSRLVGILMLSPLASGLYHRVIMMSGHAGGLYSYVEQEEAEQKALYFGGLLRCPYPSSDFKDCLKRKSARHFIHAQNNKYSSALFAHWAPVVDGKVLPDSPLKLLNEGKFNKTNILTGIANDDGTSFLPTIRGMNDGVDVSKGLTRDEFVQAISKKTWIRRQDEKVPAMIAFQYTDWLKPNDVNTTRRKYLDLLTDSIYAAPAIQSAQAFAKRGSPVYFYQFEYRENYDADGKLRPKWINVPHRGDLRYLFPKPDISSLPAMTRTMLDYWITFIKSGNPQKPGDRDKWPIYDIKNQKYQAIEGFPKVKSRLRAENMVFWNVFIPKNGVADKVPEPKHAARKDPGADTTTTALIVISCLFAILVIAFIVVVIMLLIKAKRNKQQSQDSKAYQYQSSQKPPLRSQDKTDLQSSPVHSPSYISESPMYKNSFKPVDKKEPYPYYPGDRYRQERDIEFVDRRSPTKDNYNYMESDML